MSGPAPVPSDTSPRVRHLDGLRGIAIGLVLVYHFVPPLLSQEPGSPGGYLTAALTLAYTGVDLFFVLSGYLIGGLLLDHRDSPRLYPAFYARRAARILPLALVCVAAILFAQHTGLYGPGPGEGRAPWPIAAYLLFATNLCMSWTNDWGYRPLSPLWSLAIEEQFYLFAPWLVRRVSRERMPGLLLGFIFSALLFRLALIGLHREWMFAAAMLPFGRMDCLGAGMLVAWTMRSPGAQAWCKGHQAVLGTIAALAGAGCAGLTKIRAFNAGYPMAAGGYTVVAVFYASVLLYCETHRGSGINRVLGSTPLVLLGRYSYFLYLFQGFAISLTVGLVFHRQLAIALPVTWLQLAVGLGGLLALAAASWRWLESPILRRGRRCAY